MTQQMILVAGPYRSGTNGNAVYFAFEEIPRAE